MNYSPIAWKSSESISSSRCYPTNSSIQSNYIVFFQVYHIRYIIYGISYTVYNIPYIQHQKLNLTNDASA